MRCEQVAHQIATARVGAPIPDALLPHLAACPDCAARAGRSTRLDRAWLETRVDDLPDAALDRIWLGVSQGLDDAARVPDLGPLPLSRPRRHRARWAYAAITLASAAGILGPMLLVRGPEPEAIPVAVEPRPLPASHALPRIEVNLDETVLVRIDDEGPRVLVLDDPSTNPETFPSLADATPHDVMNAMESLAQ